MPIEEGSGWNVPSLRKKWSLCSVAKPFNLVGSRLVKAAPLPAKALAETTPLTVMPTLEEI